jgi:predicted nucleic acid-binding Zn ribbon protein
MEPIQHVLPAAVAEIVRRAPVSPEKIAFAWQAAVGPAIARATEIAVADGSVLDVRVSTEAWRRELKRSTPVIIERLEKMLGPGVIARLKIAGSHPEPHGTTRWSAHRRRKTAREGASLRAATTKSASRARQGSRRKR